MWRMLSAFGRIGGSRDVHLHRSLKPAGYSRFTDPRIFPRLGGDDLDPPPYSTDRRMKAHPSSSAPKRKSGSAWSNIKRRSGA